MMMEWWWWWWCDEVGEAKQKQIFNFSGKNRFKAKAIREWDLKFMMCLHFGSLRIHLSSTDKHLHALLVIVNLFAFEILHRYVMHIMKQNWYAILGTTVRCINMAQLRFLSITFYVQNFYRPFFHTMYWNTFDLHTYQFYWTQTNISCEFRENWKYQKLCVGTSNTREHKFSYLLKSNL